MRLILGDDSDEDSDEDEKTPLQLSVRNPSPANSTESSSRYLARARFDVKLKHGATRIIPYPPSTPAHNRNASMPEWMPFKFGSPDSPRAQEGTSSPRSSPRIVESRSCAEDYGWNEKLHAISPEHLRNIRRRRRHSDFPHSEWVRQKMRQRAELMNRRPSRMTSFPEVASWDAGLGLGIRAPAHPLQRPPSVVETCVFP